MADIAEAPTEKILLLFVGYRVNAKDRVIPMWLPVTEEDFALARLPPGDERGNDSPYRSYSSKYAESRLGGIPGQVYQVAQEIGSTTVHLHGAIYRGKWKDDEKVAAWQLESREAKTAVAMQKKRDKDKEDDFDFLEPVRSRYRKLISRDHKAALLAQVLAYITG